MPNLTIINPATGRRVASVPMDDARSLRQKAHVARQAQPSWAAQPLKQRQAILRRFRDALEREAERLAVLLTTEMGKPLQQSRNELRALLGRVDYLIAEAPRALRPETVRRDADTQLEERVTLEPLGVVANISAWNYPYFVGSNVYVPALLAGNAVLYKPSEYTPQTGLATAELLHEAGVPPDVFAPVVGDGAMGAMLLEQDIDGVFFTGSQATGRRIARAVAGRMIKVQLELGGKDPVYVCDDVDVAAAAASVADGAFYNTGQSCCSVERVYVHRRVWKSFIEAFVATVRGFRVGDPMDPATYIGPLARAAQVDLLQAHVADAKAQGARLLLGGRRRRGRGHYFEPTILVDVTHRMKVMREESFGPIIGLMPADDDEAALRLMNDTGYGLTAGVYSKNKDRASALLARVNAGTVYWNCCDRVSPALPWSGRKGSGLGLTLSREGLRTFTQPKAWHLAPP